VTPERALHVELVAARALWRSCVDKEDRRGESYAMRRIDDALDRLHRLMTTPPPPRPSHL
jgi:hypothetical protein